MGAIIKMYDEQTELFTKEEIKREKRLISYIPSCFIICPLPVRTTGMDKPNYIKKYNNFTMQIQSSNGVPGGKVARDMLMLFTTEAVCAKNREGIVRIHYESVVQLAKKMGMYAKGEGYRKVLDMLEKFATCMITFKFKKIESYEKGKVIQGYLDREEIKRIPEKGFIKVKDFINVPFFNRLQSIEILKKERKLGQPIRIDFQLSQQFIEMVRENAVPIDFSIYKELQSTLEKDLYVWLIYKNSTVISKYGLFINRENILKQFGETENKENEKMNYKRIIDAIRKIKLKYYTELRLSIIDRGKTENKGIVLFNSPVIISEKDLRYVPLISI